MDDNRRKHTRRASDRVLEETVKILRLLQKISNGEGADFSEHYADLVGMKDTLGRRIEDRKLGEVLCSTIEGIAANIKELFEQERGLRKVRITKMEGKEGALLDVQTSIEGWEETRPQVGKKYLIVKENGGVFRSAVVTRVSPGYFQTRNSLYRIEVILAPG